MMNLVGMMTERRNPKTMHLDQMTPLEIATVMNQEDKTVSHAVERVLPQIAAAIEWCTESLRGDGRIIYIGAGTSGRLGLLDAAECPPTFGVSPGLVMGVLAGGREALMKAVEGAEDNGMSAAEDLKKLNLRRSDTVIGLAASGRTPYVLGGLRFASSAGCRTVLITCNEQPDTAKEAELVIAAVTGPEVLTGSTRLKAGTAEKMILNMISTGSMVGIGKVYENLMVDVSRTNEKLEVRAVNIVINAAGCGMKEAKGALAESGGNVKLAIAKILLGCDAKTAQKELELSGGRIQDAVARNRQSLNNII